MEKINTFILPHLNNPGLRKTLESIHKHTPPNFYIFLIDQNEKYQEVDDLVDLHIRVNYGRNPGFAKGMNMGIRLAETKYVSCWNDDAECINKKWWDGVMETFRRYSTAVGVNPGSPRNPRASGEAPINHPGWEYKEEFTDEEYDRMVKEVGQGHIIDGICTFATVFDREKLNKVAGTIPGVWYDEHFWPGGGEDYDLDRRAYMTKNPENGYGGYRMLGSNLAYVWHWWYTTVDPKSGKAAVKHCGNAYTDKWGRAENGGSPDIYGKNGRQTIPDNKLRPLETCVHKKK